MFELGGGKNCNYQSVKVSSSKCRCRGSGNPVLCGENQKGMGNAFTSRRTTNMWTCGLGFRTISLLEKKRSNRHF